MKSWTIGKRLTVGFGALVAVAGVLGAFAVLRLDEIDTLAASIRDEAVSGVLEFGEVDADVRETSDALLKLALTEDKAKMANLEQRIATLNDQANQNIAAYEKTMFKDEDRRLFAAFKEERARTGEFQRSFIAYAKGHSAAESGLEFDRSLAPAYAKLLEAADAESAFNKRIANEYVADIDVTVSSARLWLLVGVLLAMAGGTVIGVYIVRSTNGVLRRSVTALTEGSQQVVSAAEEVATSAQSLSLGATEQAASLEETSASMEEMASMARRNADNTQEAANLMAQVDSRVNESNLALGAMVSSMQAIGESSGKVAKIIRTIDEIAFQTNILALNAAVEAARAGEAGMGFAVVADEVRNLAQRSAQAAKDTAALIEESIVRSQEGGQKVEQVANSIGAITESVTRVKGIVEEVRTASRQQTQGIDQVSQAIAQMEQVTQTTAATAEEGAAASEELNNQAETSMGVVREIQSLVGSTEHITAPTTKAAGRAPALRDAVQSKVVPLARNAPARAAAKHTSRAEEMIPFGETGTYGKF